VPSTSINDVVLQGAEKFGVLNIEDQVNDPMEEDDNNKSIVEDDGRNELIQDLFARPDEDDDEDIGDVDVPLLEKEEKPLYEGSKENLLSATLLLVNLKVLNGLSNSCMTQILRYVIWFIITYT
jgi:hypothetical protein